MKRFDIAIIGGGIAGASLAAEVAPHASVVVLEGEDAAGYHSTGRSAAFWSETYGGPFIQPLTSASAEAIAPYLAPLGSLHIGRAHEAALIDEFLAKFEGSGVELTRVDPSAYVPGLRPEWTLGVLEPTCAYIDVAGLHGEALGRLKRGGGELWLNAGFDTATREGGDWRIETAAGPVIAGILVDAAGAWADPVAARLGAAPLGIQPYRRTLTQLRTDPPVPETMVHVAHIGTQFYFKPEAGGKLWLSPSDETLTDPCDAAPEELDVAIAIDRLEGVVDWRITTVERKWAGLRTFAPDRLPVYGFDPKVGGLFWCAGQGGFGIQTAPAAARVAAALLLDRAPDPSIAALDLGRYSPARFT